MANTQEQYTDFPVMLHVDEQGIVHYPNSDGYFDALFKSDQRRNYNMAEERSKQMRREFDNQEGALQLRSERPVKINAVELEARYGPALRTLYKKKRVPIKQLAEQFELDIKDVRLLVER